VGVLADELLGAFDGASIRWDDSFSAAVTFRGDEPFLDGVGDSYLFPSERADSGHISGTTVARWFHDLADRARIPKEIDGVPRKPHMGRRFWYDAYSQTTERVLAHVQDIVAEQGSASAQVVFEEYLTDERKRELRREFMRETLSTAFESESS